MDDSAFPLAAQLIGKAYAKQGQEAIRRREGLAKTLLSQRRLPDTGWDDASIEFLLSDLAMMDSNNFMDNVGVGEREGRVYSALVSRSHFRMSHGMGRSGDIAAVQPKAAGSSLMVQLTNLLVLDAMKLAGLSEVKAALTVPLATGMSIALALLGLRLHWKSPPSKRVVLWSRIDQKSCLKAIATAGFEVVPVPLQLCGDELRTDVAAFAALLAEHGDRVFACVTTASCFAPRAPDDVEGVARLCAASPHGVGHLVNNAYGLQCRATMQQLSRAMRVGRVDCCIQSTDKNYLVPVGGAVVAGQDPAAIAAIGQAYPGRASSAPIQDLFITLLSMGAQGYKALLAEREAMADHLQLKLSEVAAKHGERVLSSPNNRISFGMTLDSFTGGGGDETYLGSMLFTRSVSGTRVVPQNVTSSVGGLAFNGFGSSHPAYPHAYLTAAAAIGGTRAEANRFVDTLDKSMAAFKQKRAKDAAKAEKRAAAEAPLEAALPVGYPRKEDDEAPLSLSTPDSRAEI